MALTCKEKILSDDYADLITNLLQPQYNYELPIDYCYHLVDDELAILYVNRNELAETGTTSVNYSVMPKVYGLTQLVNPVLQPPQNLDNSIAFLDAGILQVKEQPLNLSGKNVVVGFIDTGIQYENPAFCNQYGESRILAIWDQTIQEGVPPEGFVFGTEYTKQEIDEALRTQNPRSVVPTTDTNGHGTAMASVAVGKIQQNNIDETYSQLNLGVATDAEIVVVKLKESKDYLRNYYFIQEDVPCYQENDVILAIQYLQKFARLLYRPLVICLGIGTNLGDHTGRTLLDQYITKLSLQKSRAFVIANGNEGNNSHHYRGFLYREEDTKEIEIRIGENCKGFVLDFWGKLPYDFITSVRSPSGERVDITQVSGVRNRPAQPLEYNFIFGNSKLFVESYLIEQFAGAQLIRFRFENPIHGIWTVQVRNKRNAPDAIFDMWLPIKEFLTSEVVFLRADPDITMTEPSYVSEALSVGAYSIETQGIWQESGRGFARNDAIKPDLAAPGIQINTVLGRRSGTSMAAAITAGAVALFFQWAVVEQNEIYADSNLIRNYFIRGATRQENVTYPNQQWGYGKLNVEGIFKFIAGL